MRMLRDPYPRVLDLESLLGAPRFSSAWAPSSFWGMAVLRSRVDASINLRPSSPLPPFGHPLPRAGGGRGVRGLSPHFEGKGGAARPLSPLAGRGVGERGVWRLPGKVGPRSCHRGAHLLRCRAADVIAGSDR